MSVIVVRPPRAAVIVQKEPPVIVVKKVPESVVVVRKESQSVVVVKPVTPVVVVKKVSPSVVVSGARGPSGPVGPVGPPGPQGEAGDGLLAGTYHHIQASPTSIWDITHNLGFHPNVTVIDSAGSNVEGEVSYPSLNTLVITFTGGFSGDAYLS